MTDPMLWLGANYPLVLVIVGIVGGPKAIQGGIATVRRGVEWWAARRVERAAKEIDAEKEVRLAQIAAEADADEREDDTVKVLLDEVRADRQANRAEIAALRRDVDECKREKHECKDELAANKKDADDKITELQKQVERMSESLPVVVKREVKRASSNPGFRPPSSGEE